MLLTIRSPRTRADHRARRARIAAFQRMEGRLLLAVVDVTTIVRNVYDATYGTPFASTQDQYTSNDPAVSISHTGQTSYSNETTTVVTSASSTLTGTPAGAITGGEFVDDNDITVDSPSNYNLIFPASSYTEFDISSDTGGVITVNYSTSLSIDYPSYITHTSSIGVGSGTLTSQIPPGGVFSIFDSLSYTGVDGTGVPSQLHSYSLGTFDWDYSPLSDMAPTTTTVASSANSIDYGQAVTFTATVAAAPDAGTPTGTVTFMTSGTILGEGTLDADGVTSIDVSDLPVAFDGYYYITATYTPDSSDFQSSTSSPLYQVVNPDATTTLVTSSQNPSDYGQNVTFIATVSNENFGPDNEAIPAGTVEFFVDGVLAASQSLDDGSTSFDDANLSAAGHKITAAYTSSNLNFTTSTSAALSQAVSQDSTSTALTSSVNPSDQGQDVTFTATVAATAPARAPRRDQSHSWTTRRSWAKGHWTTPAAPRSPRQT